MKRLLILICFLMSSCVQASTPGRLADVTARMRIYEHPGPLHHEYILSNPIVETDGPTEYRFNFPVPGHNIPYVERFYTAQRPFKSTVTNLVSTNLETTVEFGVTFTPAWRNGITWGRGPYISYQKFEKTDTFVQCATGANAYAYLKDGTMPGRLTVMANTTVMHSWSPTSNESTYIEVDCEWNVVPDPYRVEFFNVVPPVLNLFGFTGKVISSDFKLEIGGHKSYQPLQMLLRADVPTGVSLTREGFSDGSGFNDDPITVPNAGLSVRGTVKVVDTRSGSRTYSVPIHLSFI